MKRSKSLWLPNAFAVATLILFQVLPVAAASEGSFQRTLTVNGPVHMDLTTGSGNVEVRTGSSNQVQVTGHIRVTEWFGGNGEDKIKRLEKVHQYSKVEMIFASVILTIQICVTIFRSATT